MMGFIIWCVIGILIIAAGIRCFIIKEPFNFIKEKVLNINNYKSYNICIGLFWIVIGIGIICAGLPFILNTSLIVSVTTTITVVLLIVLFVVSLLLMSYFEKKE